VPWAPQGIYAKKDINTIEDMKGLKWRSYNVGHLAHRRDRRRARRDDPGRGAAAGARHRRGQLLHVVGGTGYDSKVWESLTHFYDTQAWIPKNVTFVNKAAFDALDKPTQDAILKAAKTAEERGWKAGRRRPAGISTSSRRRA
jgi:hypothetical protein